MCVCDKIHFPNNTKVPNYKTKNLTYVSRFNNDADFP